MTTLYLFSRNFPAEAIAFRRHGYWDFSHGETKWVLRGLDCLLYDWYGTRMFHSDQLNGPTLNIGGRFIEWFSNSDESCSYHYKPYKALLLDQLRSEKAKKDYGVAPHLLQPYLDLFNGEDRASIEEAWRDLETQEGISELDRLHDLGEVYNA